MGEPTMTMAYEDDMAMERRCRSLKRELHELAARLDGYTLAADARLLADKLEEKQAQLVRKWESD